MPEVIAITECEGGHGGWEVKTICAMTEDEVLFGLYEPDVHETNLTPWKIAVSEAIKEHLDLEGHPILNLIDYKVIKVEQVPEEVGYRRFLTVSLTWEVGE